MRVCGWRALCTIVLLVAGGTRAEAEWKAATARIRITPERPLWMAGYDARNKPFEAVEADIWAKTLALEDERGSRAVLVTADVIGFSTSVAEAVTAAIRQKTGLERNQILLNASHNHSGPALSLDLKPRGNISGGKMPLRALPTPGRWRNRSRLESTTHCRDSRPRVLRGEAAWLSL